MAEYPKKLEQWFIKMGYPIDEARSVDWKTVCRGKTLQHWKEMMSTMKPKQEVQNIKRNIALKDIQDYIKREGSSAAKIGIIKPPVQVFYPEERKRLQNKLDKLNIELSTKRHLLKNILDDRKQKCIEMQETKQKITATERQIWFMKQVMEMLKKDMGKYEEILSSIHKFMMYLNFKDNNKKYIMDKSHINEKETSLKKFFSILQSMNSSHSDNNDEFLDTFVQDVLEKNDKSKIENGLNAHVFNITDIHQAIIEFQKKLPQIITENILNTSNVEKLDKVPYNLSTSCNVFNENIKSNSLKNSLLQMDVFHSRLVIATLQNKKECEEIKTAVSAIESEVIKQMSNDNNMINIFKLECQRIGSIAYEESCMQEVKDLKNYNGIYMALQNKFKESAKKMNAHDLMNLQSRHIVLQSEIRHKIKDTHDLLEKVNKNNKLLKHNLVEMQENSQKLLWKSDFQLLQDRYVSIFSKYQSIFNIETGNPYGSLVYPSTIVSHYCNKEMILKESTLLQEELQHVLKFLGYSLFLQNILPKSIENDDVFKWNQTEQLQSVKIVYNLISRKAKFKRALENIIIRFQSGNLDTDWADSLLGCYLEVQNLQDAEQKSLTNVTKYFKKINSIPNINLTLDEFTHIHEFCTDFYKK